jgi:hypothetical protein
LFCCLIGISNNVVSTCVFEVEMLCFPSITVCFRQFVVEGTGSLIRKEEKITRLENLYFLLQQFARCLARGCEHVTLLERQARVRERICLIGLPSCRAFLGGVTRLVKLYRIRYRARNNRAPHGFSTWCSRTGCPLVQCSLLLFLRPLIFF